MCVAALAWRAHPRWLAVLASNRDEFVARPTARLHGWATPGGTPIWAGRDAQAGGTWLAVAGHRLALVTNLRTPEALPPGAPSRGGLPLAAIDGAPLPPARQWNLILADWRSGEAWRHSSAAQARQPLAPGVVTLSNGPLDACWPKQRRLAGFVQAALAAPDVPDAATLTQRLLAALADRAQPPEPSWPHTGVAREVEGWLSPICVASPDGRYATRISTVVVVEATAQGLCVTMTERRLDEPGGETRLSGRAQAVGATGGR